MSNIGIHDAQKSSATGIDADQKQVVQDFFQLREECLTKKTNVDDTEYLFEDPTFPAHISSIFPDGIPSDRTADFEDFVWKRPGEITDNPQFFVDGFSRFDVIQTQIGDCWVLASLSSLAMHPRLFYQVVPQDQGFEETNYAGIFHFRFWQFGKWVDVVVDDRLPVKSKSKLLIAQSVASNEFWIPLVEKAYAKLYGSWMAIEGGFSVEALEDFTGGLAFHYIFADAGGVSFDTLQYAHNRNALMVCASESVKSEEIAMERKMKRKGIATAHSYSITKVVNYRGKELLRLRNPWGEFEWTGKFSDKKKVWDENEDMKKALDFKLDNDGEFYMPYERVHNYFSGVQICYVPILGDDKKQLEAKAFQGKWVRPGPTAKDIDLLEAEIMSKNMQFRITLENPDTEDGKCTVTVALMQKNRRKKRAENLSMGVKMYHLANPDEPTPLTANFFKDERNKLRSGSAFGLKGLREVYSIMKLKPGTYCVIPCVYSRKGKSFRFTCNEEEEFLLRVFIGNIPNVKEAIMTMVSLDH